jgi:hypothetical protein
MLNHDVADYGKAADTSKHFCKCAGSGDLLGHYRYRDRSSKYATLSSELNHGTDKVWQSYRYRLCSSVWQTLRYYVLL